MDLNGYEGKKVWITVEISNKSIFYTGIIKEVNKDRVVLIDKFDKEIILDPKSIKKAEVEK